MNSYGICERLVLKPIDCPRGQYFDQVNGCVPCTGACRECSSATKCLSCREDGYQPDANGQCRTFCGDGKIVGLETCDTGNLFSLGCVNCQTQPGFTCVGQPSVCKPNIPVLPPPLPPLPPVNPPHIGLSQSGDININTNNVFITLETNPTFTFSTPTEMQNFIRADFPSGPKPTVYCAQRDTELEYFDCLMIYPSGVPNQSFNCDFKYDYQGKHGEANIVIDPLKITNNVQGSSDRINDARRRRRRG